jgi:hypothetical protein
MFALVESGSISKMLSGNRGITIGDNQYPRSIFTLWSADEREAIGIYEVEIDTTNKKDEEWYVNTNITYSFGSEKVTGSYGSATAKAIADTLFTAEDESNGLGTEGEVKVKGLKTLKKEIVKVQAAGILQETDWYVTRKADAGTAIPSAVSTHRAAVRTKSGEMETAIDNASDVDALAALYTYTEQEDGSVTRPLGEFPVLEA